MQCCDPPVSNVIDADPLIYLHAKQIGTKEQTGGRADAALH